MENLIYFFIANPFHSDCSGEALGQVKKHLDSRNFYRINPAFDQRDAGLKS
ncbi:MAG: hypothetical protein IJN34_05800 [Clostridia bacterium]|nr:hypothetical protein [Clostridia bacterium]